MLLLLGLGQIVLEVCIFLGVSVSANFLKNGWVSRVFEATTWRSNSVFSSSYLEDIYYIFEICHSFGPFFTTGDVLE